MIIVSDTTPISSLYRIHRLFLLNQLFGDVILPGAVMDELMQLKKWGYNVEEITTLSWIEVKNVTNNENLQRLSHILDSGEAEAIALAKELHANLLLTDDMKARIIAKKEGLQIVGTLGVLLRAKKVGIIPNVKEPLDALIKDAKFRIGEVLYQEILLKAGE